MKTGFLFLAALLWAGPAHALSIVSLHGAMSAPMAAGPVDSVIVILGVLALAAVIGFRAMRR
jgi:hypothetical protein